MTDIVEFLRARLDEDEAVARDAILPDRPGSHWEWEVPDDTGDPESPLWLRTVEEFPTTSGVGDLPGFPLGYDCKAAPSSAMAHIARHDPARVLREVEAKRRLLDLADEISRSGAEFAEQDHRTMTRALAAVYSDHADYQQEWDQT